MLPSKRRMLPSKRSIGRLKRFRKVVKTTRERLLLALWKKGELPTQQIAAKDWDGNGITLQELLVYSERHLTIHDDIVNPATLCHHIMYPRTTGMRCGSVSHDLALQMLEVYVHRELAGTRYKPIRNCVGNWPMTAGTQPTGCWWGLFHGGHPSSSKQIAHDGLHPVHCERKCMNRKRFGKRIFYCSSLAATWKWVQYADLGALLLKSHHGCVGWYVGMMTVHRDPYGDLPRVSKIASFPDMFIFDLRQEYELSNMGRKMSPHVGDFRVPIT